MKIHYHALLFTLGLLLLTTGCDTQTNPLPIASISATPTSGQVPLTVYFDGSASYDPDGTITAYNWFFGDGYRSTEKTISHTFTTIGNYGVTLTVTDDRGEFSLPATATIYVKTTEASVILPTVEATLTSEGISDLYVAGNYAYLVDRSAGLKIVDVSNKMAPRILSTFAAAATPTALFVSGNYAYLAEGSSGLQIVNVSNPDSPSSVSTYKAKDTVNDVYVSGSYAYLTAGSTLEIVNLTNISSPTLEGSYQTSSTAYGIYLSGNYAYLANGTAGLTIVDVSTPAKPTLTGSYETGGTVYDLYVSGNYVYVAAGYSGVQIIDCTTKSNPKLTGKYTNAGLVVSLAVSGSALYFPDSYQEPTKFNYYSLLRTLDISTPTSPTLASTVMVGGAALAAFLVDKDLYLAVQDTGMKIYRVP